MAQRGGRKARRKERRVWKAHFSRICRDLVYAAAIKELFARDK